MKNNDFKRFCLDIFLGIMIIVGVILSFNFSGIFDDDENSSLPEQMWRNFSQDKIINKPDILFTGNSQAQNLNPHILDSITQKSSNFFGFLGAGIEPLSWFFQNSWDNIKVDLIVLETHSFKPTTKRSFIDSIRLARWENDYPRFNNSNQNLNYISWSKINFLRDFNFLNREELRLPYIITGPAIVNRHFFITGLEPVYKALFPSKKDSLNGFIKRGYLPISDTLQNHYNNGVIPVLESPVDHKALQKVKTIINLCKARGIKVLVYESPMYYKHSIYQKKRYNQLDSICSLLEIPFVNLNDDHSLTRNARYFENTLKQNQHLTSEGADAVSEVIANKILELNLVERK